MFEKYRFARPVLLLTFLASMLGYVGCYRGPVIAPVSGKVTVNGEALTTGRIRFFPDSGRPAAGRIASDGSYEITTYEPGDGAVVGEYHVTISAHKTVNPEPVPTSLEDEIKMGKEAPRRAAQVVPLVPEEYEDQNTTPLTATVEDKDNQINFDIKL